MDDQEDDTHSEVTKEDWPDPRSEDETKERSNILQLWRYTSWRLYILFCVHLCWHSNLSWSEGVLSIPYFGARLR